MINNFLTHILYVVLLLSSTPGTESFVITHKSVSISPLYRKKVDKFVIHATPETLSTVSELVALKFDTRKEDISPDSDFLKEFGADKLDEVELLISLEDEFDLNIPNDQFKTLRTVKDIANYIERRLKDSRKD